MKRKLYFLTVMALMVALPSMAQIKIKGIGHWNRYDNGDQMESEYVGWNSALGKAIFIVEQGIYAMTWDGTTLSTPVKEPPVNKSDFYSNGQFTDNDKALWANNFNLMVGNSGAAYVHGQLVTVYSRDEQSTVDEVLFAVRKWDANTGDLLSNPDDYMAMSSNIESAGMCYNPKDGLVYGLFYLTNQDLGEEITSDPDFFVDQDGDATSTDAGYCLCTVDINTMQITPITPGLYYRNFVAFAINSEGRAFAITSGGTGGYEGADGKMYNIDNELTGAELCEFDLTTGIMKTVPTPAVDPETGESYVEQVNPYPALGYCSQYSRQSACFAKSNPNILYWNGFYNSGKGVNEYGSWTSLPDREWRTNGKYDTCLYTIDITTGECTRVAMIPNRWRFSCMWIDGDDCSDEMPTLSKPTISYSEGKLTFDCGTEGATYYSTITDTDIASYNSSEVQLGVTYNISVYATCPGYEKSETATATLCWIDVEPQTEGITDAVASIKATPVLILSENGRINITGADDGTQVYVYNVTGQQVGSAVIQHNEANIFTNLHAGNVAVIRIGNRAVKVIMK
ncbi:MAG: hypothetical protein IKX22_00205 [Prevotella sp.]|nr:hypothetical protein [Prevotella sp.]